MKIMGITFLDGWARKVGLVAILASMLGWLIFIVCFGSFNNGDNFYNDVREKQVVVVNGVPLPLALHPTLGMNVEQIVEEDFPENRADPDFFTFYFFAVVFPFAAVLTATHLILHGIPIGGFIVSLIAHILLILSVVCGSGVFWAEGNRLFSKDNNYRNEFGSAILPEDWLQDPYWGAWLVGEWVGTLITGICVIVYFTVTPFFTNPGNLFSRSTESYEMDSKRPL
jgi:hypothetical protein